MSAIVASVFLAAIAQVETGWTDLTKPCPKVGRAGERSAWQFTRATWRLHTTKDFAVYATLGAEYPRLVAAMHLDYLQEKAKARGIDATPWAIAYAWNAGPGGWRRKPTVRSSTYATCVEALYHDLLRQGNPLPAVQARVWLQSVTGEGGMFPADQVAKVMHDPAMLRGYFWANF